MRYAYHGKVRQSGLRVDGHIEAVNSVEAIDLLADKGIIGVYTVRPDPLPEIEKPKVLAAPEPALANSDVALGQIVDKLTTLIGQVEKLLTRQIQMSGAGGPVRDGGGNPRLKRPVTNDVQNSALRDIFQSNLDLRRSLAKLTSAAAALRESESAPVLAQTANDADDDDAAAVVHSTPAVVEMEDEVVLDSHDVSTPSLGRAVAQSAA